MIPRRMFQKKGDDKVNNGDYKYHPDDGVWRAGNADGVVVEDGGNENSHHTDTTDVVVVPDTSSSSLYRIGGSEEEEEDNNMDDIENVNINDNDDDDDDVDNKPQRHHIRIGSSSVTNNGTNIIHDDDEIGESLPTAEEIKRETNFISNEERNKLTNRLFKHRYMILILFICIIILMILGIAIIGIKKSKQNSSENSNSNTSKRRNVDLQTLTNYLQDQYRIELFEAGQASSSFNTPQFKAARWLSEMDGANFHLPGSSGNDEDDNEVYKYRYLARYLMAVQYYATDGPNWKNQFNFLSSKDICDWIGYIDTSSNDVELAGIFCDAISGTPYEISLFHNDLSGTIVSELGLLTSLRIIDFKYNNLIGTIPTELCSLTKLSSLFFGYNNMDGTIPECIGTELTNLLRIFWSNNHFHGSIPSSFQQLTSLERFIVDDNMLTGNPIHIWNSMKQLTMIMIDSNEFHGILDENFLSYQHNNISILDISHNNFTSSNELIEAIPSHLWNMPNLQVLDVSSNQLTGILPESNFVYPNNELRFLSLYRNKISGSIPSMISTLQSLYHIDMSNNTFTGIIPSELGE